MSTRNDFSFELTEKFNYGHKGDSVEAQMITFFAPNSKTLTLCADLKQYFFQAMPDSSPDKKTEISESTEVEIDGSGIMMMISGSSKVKLSSVLLTARELFSNKEIALVDGEEKLTQPLLDKISNDDLEDMTGEYMANFILASALRKMNKKLSEGSVT